MPFESLQFALAKLFEKPFAELPKILQQRVRKEFQPSWDDLSVTHRKQFAELWDYNNDPAKESDRQYWWDFYQRMQVIENQIEHWTSIATPTATDLAAQEKRLEELKLELEMMKKQEKQSQISLSTAKPSGHLNHDQEWQTRANEIATKLKADKKRVPTKNEVAKKLAEEIETPVDTVLRRIRAEWK